MPGQNKSFNGALDRAKNELSNHDPGKFSDAAIEEIGQIACNQLSYILREARRAAKEDGSDLVSAKHITLALSRLSAEQRSKAPRVAVLFGGIFAAAGVQLMVTPGVESYGPIYWGIAAVLMAGGCWAIAWAFSRD